MAKVYAGTAESLVIASRLTVRGEILLFLFKKKGREVARKVKLKFTLHYVVTSPIVFSSDEKRDPARRNFSRAESS